jgi:hypothetical protein
LNHVVMYSGGVGSWATALRVAEKIKGEKKDHLFLLFADTAMEDEDLYRFITDAKKTLPQAEFVWLGGEENVWDVFFREHYIGNSRIDPCSKNLKRIPMRKWLEAMYVPEYTTVYLGMDWTEGHRVERAAKFWHPWKVEYPMMDPPYLSKKDMIELCSKHGIEPPRLYKMGFPHNNCGGFCVKAGQAQFRLLLKTMPERYAYHEQKEREFRELFEKDVTILRDYRNGGKPMTLEAFRKREDKDVDKEEWGGCGCITPGEEEKD